MSRRLFRGREQDGDAGGEYEYNDIMDTMSSTVSRGRSENTETHHHRQHSRAESESSTFAYTLAGIPPGGLQRHVLDDGEDLMTNRRPPPPQVPLDTSMVPDKKSKRSKLKKFVNKLKGKSSKDLKPPPGPSASGAQSSFPPFQTSHSGDRDDNLSRSTSVSTSDAYGSNPEYSSRYDYNQSGRSHQASPHTSGQMPTFPTALHNSQPLPHMPSSYHQQGHTVSQPLPRMPVPTPQGPLESSLGAAPDYVSGAPDYLSGAPEAQDGTASSEAELLEKVLEESKRMAEEAQQRGPTEEEDDQQLAKILEESRQMAEFDNTLRVTRMMTADLEDILHPLKDYYQQMVAVREELEDVFSAQGTNRARRQLQEVETGIKTVSGNIKPLEDAIQRLKDFEVFVTTEKPSQEEATALQRHVVSDINAELERSGLGGVLANYDQLLDEGATVQGDGQLRGDYSEMSSHYSAATHYPDNTTVGMIPPVSYDMQPQAYDMPPQDYDMVQGDYGMPPQDYDMVQGDYGMPPDAYAMPPQGYGMPPQAYLPPQGYQTYDPAAHSRSPEGLQTPRRRSSLRNDHVRSGSMPVIEEGGTPRHGETQAQGTADQFDPIAPPAAASHATQQATTPPQSTAQNNTSSVSAVEAALRDIRETRTRLEMRLNNKRQQKAQSSTSMDMTAPATAGAATAAMAVSAPAAAAFSPGVDLPPDSVGVVAPGFKGQTSGPPETPSAFFAAAPERSAAPVAADTLSNDDVSAVEGHIAAGVLDTSQESGLVAPVRRREAYGGANGMEGDASQGGVTSTRAAQPTGSRTKIVDHYRDIRGRLLAGEVFEDVTAGPSVLSKIKPQTDPVSRLISRLGQEISSKEFKDMSEVVDFVRDVENNMAEVKDRSVVLESPDWPGARYDALVEAVQLQRELKSLAESQQQITPGNGEFEDEVTHVINMFESTAGVMEIYEGKRVATMLKMSQFGIPFDSLVYKEAKQAARYLAVFYMNIVICQVANLEILDDGEGNQSEEILKLLVNAMQMVFRFHMFVGSFDSDCQDHKEKLTNLTKKHLQIVSDREKQELDKFSGKMEYESKV